MFSKNYEGFSYIDAIYGLTIILIIIGAIYGSVNIIERNFRKGELLSSADQMAQNIMEEVRLRKFDENIDNFPQVSLTNTEDFGVDGDEANDLKVFDDVDDFHQYTFENEIIDGLNAEVSVSYVLYDIVTMHIELSQFPTTLKRVKIDISHSEFDNLFTYTGIVGSGLSPDALAVPSYPTEILLVDREEGLNVVTANDVLNFQVVFNEPVFVINNQPDFSLYIDLNAQILRGDEGSYTVQPSSDGELRANYLPEQGIDPNQVSTNTLNFRINLPDTITSRNQNDFITYDPQLVIENGAIQNLDGADALLVLPTESDSFLGTTNILPLLPIMETKIYTADEADEYGTVTRTEIIEENLQQILASWPRAVDYNYYLNPADIPNTYPGSNAKKFELSADGQTINSTINYHGGTISLLSPEDEQLTKYTFEAIFQSNNDDDGIGFVIAFKPNKQLQCDAGVQQGDPHSPINNTLVCTTRDGTQHHFLVAWRTGWGSRATDWGDNQFAVTHGRGKTVLLHTGPTELRVSDFTLPTFIHDKKQIQGDERQGWARKVDNQGPWIPQWTKVKVERTGDYGENINVFATRFFFSKAEAENAVYDMNNSITVDLTADHRYHKFLGPAQYGYIVWSQSNANWHDTKIIKTTVVRRDVAILLDGGDSQTVDEFHRVVDGVYSPQEVSTLRSYVGYMRMLKNPDTESKFLITEDSIIEYPAGSAWND